MAIHALSKLTHPFLRKPLATSFLIQNVDKDTHMVIEPDGRYIHRLNQPIPVRLAMKEEVALNTFIYRMVFDDVHANKALGHLTG